MDELEIYNKECFRYSDKSRRRTDMRSIGATIVRYEGKIVSIIVPVIEGYDCETVYTENFSEENFNKKYSWIRID